MQTSETNTNPNLWKLIADLKKEEALARKKKCDIDRGDAIPMKNMYIKINENLQRQMRLYNPTQKMHYLRCIAYNLHTF